MQTTCPRCGLFHPSQVACPVSGLLGSAPSEVRQPGEIIAGRYRVDRVLHRGGMSTVYLAVDTLLQDRPVALKELRPAPDATLEDVREAEAWFARESALLSVLHHPLIPSFYSVFREEGHSYIAQEYVPGANLDELIGREGPIEEQTAVEWGIALCDLLDYLHGRPDPVVFRDLKPANVLVRPSGADPDCRLAVVDFGIARRFQSDTVGTVIGTPGYAPPEQYQGLATPQSDIYALGATLHRALTGYDPEHPRPDQPLFSFPAADELNPNLSSRMAEVLARAVALAPADRFANAVEFRAALQGLSARRFRATPFGSRSASSGRRALAVMAAVLLVPLMLSQVLRLAQLPLENGYYATAPSGAQPWSAQPSLGSYAPPTGCTPPQAVVDAQTASTVCGPDGTVWDLNLQSNEIIHFKANGDRTVFTIDSAKVLTDATLVSPSIKASHCNCVWLVDGSRLQIRLNADGNHAKVGLPATVLPKVSSGLLQP